MTHDAAFWLLIGSMAVANFLLRYSFFFIFGRWEVPGLVRAILPFIPAAALSALVAPMVAPVHLGWEFALQPRFLAWLGAMVVAWRTRNMFLTIAGGLVLLWLIENL